MKYLLLITFSLLISFESVAQKHMKYNVKTQAALMELFKKNPKIQQKMSELKMDPKTQLIYMESMSLFGALSVEDRIHVGAVCLPCLYRNKLISKTEHKALSDFFDSKGVNVKGLLSIKKHGKYSTPLAQVVIVGGIAGALQNGATGYGFWKSVVKVIGAIVGGGGGAIVGGGGGAIAGGIAGDGVGAIPGAIYGAGAGGVAGAGLGSDLGETVGEAIDEYLAGNSSSGNGNQNVVARPDGSDCSGYPIRF